MSKKETHFGHLWESWHLGLKEAQDILIDHARQRKTITYGELSGLIQTIHVPHNSYAMTGLLREIHHEDVKYKRPGLATLVVRKSDGRPGAGYFKDMIDAGADQMTMEAYWQARFEEICTYWLEHDEGRLE